MGQFLGMFALTAVSAGAALAALVIPKGWTALLGLVPLLLGVQKLWQRRADLRRREENNERARDKEDKEHVLERRRRSQVFAVATVTMANGGDNLAVYIPVFARDVHAIPVYMVTFAVMTGLWCAAGYKLVHNARVGEYIRGDGHILLPVVLIVIGAWILRGASALFG